MGAKIGLIKSTSEKFQLSLPCILITQISQFAILKEERLQYQGKMWCYQGRYSGRICIFFFTYQPIFSFKNKTKQNKNLTLSHFYFECARSLKQLCLNHLKSKFI